MENSTWSGSCPHCGCPIEGVHYEGCNRNKGKINYSVNEPKTMLNEYKEKKLAEFQDKFYDTIAGEPDTEEGIFIKIPKENCHTEIKQFISDLIDEMERAIPAAKDETYIVNCIQCKDENAKS
jgi:hypothetical protein